MADNEAIPTNNIDENLSEQAVKETLLPDQFKTVLGKMVKLVGKQYSENIALLTYSTSKMQGNALINPQIDNSTLLLEKVDALYEEGFLEDEDGNETDLILLPIDAIDLSSELKGVIVDCDLRSYLAGFNWLLDPDGAFIQNQGGLEKVIGAVLGFIQAMRHLIAKHYQMGLIDGHQFFFNAEYGAFQFAFDGVNMLQFEEEMSDSEKSNVENAVSAIIMYLFTGAWPDNKNCLLEYPDDADENSLFWDEETNDICGSDASLTIWNGLPASIKDALFQTCLSNLKQNISLDDWEQILISSLSEIEQCAFCGNDIFASAMNCIFCGNSTSKDSLLTKWIIKNEAEGYYLKISFGRGTVLTGEILGINAKSSPFMKIMYNSKANSLGIKNLSGISWFTEVDGNLEEKLPGKIMPVEPGLEIHFDGYSDIIMQFNGYEAR